MCQIKYEHEPSFLFQFINLGKSLLIIDDVSRGDNKQSG